MIAIKSAGIARGYSGVDHLITGSELNAVVVSITARTESRVGRRKK